MKTMKHIIWMAALTLTAATWSACSNEDEPTATEQPAQARTYTLTTTLSPRDGGAATRSTMTDVGGTTGITAEWEVNDQIWVYYEDNSTDGSTTTTATVTYVNPTTKAATITVTLIEPKNGGDITFGYPLSHWDGSSDPDTDQIGTLDDINANHASISGSGTLTVSGTDVTLPTVTMSPEMCIWKFSFTDGTNNITSAITNLVIDFPDNGMTYEVSPTSLSNIYVALYGDVVNAQPVSITATTASGVYRKAAASVTLAVGKTYTSTGVALKKAEVGKVLGADGNIYDNAGAATTAGTTGVAKITYVGGANGEAAPYNHGLALAMSDANSENKCVWKSAPLTDAGHTKQSNSSFTAESGLQYNSFTPDHNTADYYAFKYAIANNGTAAPTGCSAWFLPSGYQWNQILGASTSYSALRTSFSGVGGTNMNSDYYWSSTEISAEYVWRYKFDGYGWQTSTKNAASYVRSALAF